MLKKRVIPVVLLLFASEVAFGHEFDAVRQSAEYLCGYGFGSTYDEADKSALEDLTSQISLTVVSSFEKEWNETDDEFHERISSTLKTYSNATLTNAEHKVVQSKNGFEAIRYIKRSELSKVFKSRTDKLKDYVNLAKKAEAKLKIDDALRNYYRALILVQTLPNNGSIKGVDMDGDSVTLAVWIPARMSSILENLSIVKGTCDENSCELNFLSGGKSVSSLEFRYFDGVDMSQLISVRDGRSMIELRPGVSSDIIQLYYEYAFENELHIDAEVATAEKTFRRPVIRAATAQVDVSQKRESKKQNKLEASAIETTSSIVCNSIDSVDASQQRQVMANIFQSIRSGKYDSCRDFFTTEGWETFQGIIHYGNARLFNSMKPSDYVFLQYGDKVICRSIPMIFSFRNNIRRFTENVTFTFNKEGRIENLAFSLGQDAERDILTKGAWSPQARMAIMNFLEDYKTAFALKDTAYIRSVFDDHAVIVVGKMVRPTADFELKTTLGDKVAEYTTLSKEEYMKRLTRSFNSNEFINIRFANNDVKKGGTEVYGIQIKQDYYSSNYGDTGYLYLQVDLNEPDKPLIQVRTWQPERDPDFGIFSMSDF